MARILIVDDDEAIRTSLRKTLERAGHAVFGAMDGAAALRFLATNGVDVVITDLYMPDVDGIELIGRLRREGTVERIIAVTGGGQVAGQNLLTVAKVLGADVTLAKPFTREQLLEAVDQLMNKPSGPDPKGA